MPIEIPTAPAVSAWTLSTDDAAQRVEARSRHDRTLRPETPAAAIVDGSFPLGNAVAPTPRAETVAQPIRSDEPSSRAPGKSCQEPSVTYNWTTFTVHTIYRSTRDAVWRAWATPAGLESFFIREATVTAHNGERRAKDSSVCAGDAYHWRFWHDFELRGQILAVTPGDSLTFTFGSMETNVSLHDLNGAVEVALRQSNCRSDPEGSSEDHLNCRSCWVYFMTNLKSVIDTGHDLRDPDEPAWPDAVSIHWPPAT